MKVYRVSKTRYSRDLTGEGARLNGGRWNHILTPCIYTSASRALAVLEFTVNVSPDEIPPSLSITTFEIPDNAIAKFKPADLPADWNLFPAPASAKDFGTVLLKKAVKPVLQLPSVIIPMEFNYILNPLHPISKDFKIVAVEDFVYDVRIKL